MQLKHALLAFNLLAVSNIACIEKNRLIAIKSEKEFDHFLQKSSTPLIAQFHSGCPVCNSTRQHLQKITTEYSNIQFVEVDINTVPNLSQRYDIIALPTVLIFEPGNMKPKHTIVGPNREILIAKIDDTLPHDTK